MQNSIKIIEKSMENSIETFIENHDLFDRKVSRSLLKVGRLNFQNVWKTSGFYSKICTCAFSRRSSAGPKQIENAMPTSMKKQAFSIQKRMQKSSKIRWENIDEKTSKKEAKKHPKVVQKPIKNQWKTSSKNVIDFWYIFDAKISQKWSPDGSILAQFWTIWAPKDDGGVKAMQVFFRKHIFWCKNDPKWPPNEPPRLPKWPPRLPKWSPELQKLIPRLPKRSQNEAKMDRTSSKQRLSKRIEKTSNTLRKNAQKTEPHSSKKRSKYTCRPRSGNL